MPARHSGVTPREKCLALSDHFPRPRLRMRVMAIVLDDVHISLSGAEIVGGLTATIEEGTSVALIGHSGVGKSTVLRVMAGLQSITRGSVLVEGVPPWQLHGDGRISLIFQVPALWPQLTARETMEVTYRLQRHAPDAVRIAAVLREVGLQHASDLYPHQLSVGMAARLALARAFCIPPRVLLLDEPFAAVDPLRRGELSMKLEELREAGNTTTVWVTHDLEEALRFSTSVIVLGGKPATVIARVNLGAVPFGLADEDLPPDLAEAKQELRRIIRSAEVAP